MSTMLNLLFLLAALEPIWAYASPEEGYLLPQTSGEDDDLYLYVDTRSESEQRSSEPSRRSTLYKNFARLGRGDLPANYEMEEGYDRPTRVLGDKSDQFIRFGRGNSDFLRFGRDKGHFLRFGRSGSTVKSVRNKRSANFEKRPERNSNFLRFGRNDNFMRFGRDPEVVYNQKHNQVLQMLMDLLRKQKEQQKQQQQQQDEDIQA
ncbi:PREDICTED: FMRFamide-related peptides [Nicrophorus vespilloides]|uniref:FMRFamide-related peptides n=1 Tax=Nicrophorus vespilloides TaxID=110193 RepID=A0ABM1NBZ7_NICVS|nr:PREDICTED: FMRFamide-related peptides [Nicrophorus vespilloides]